MFQTISGRPGPVYPTRARQLHSIVIQIRLHHVALGTTIRLDRLMVDDLINSGSYRTGTSLFANERTVELRHRCSEVIEHRPAGYMSPSSQAAVLAI